MQIAIWLIVVGLSGQVGADDRYGSASSWLDEQPARASEASPPSAGNRLRSTSQSDAAADAAAGSEGAPTNSPGSLRAGTPAAEPYSPATDAAPLRARPGSSTGGVYAPATGTVPEASMPAREDRRGSPTDAGASQAKPSQLIERLQQAPASGQLAGVSLSLAEAVEGSSSRREQTRRVVAYWDLSTAVADYYLAHREGVELRALKASVARPGPEWDEALSKLDVRTQAARRAAEAAQFQMQRMLGERGQASLPLPSDLPHGGRYETRYESIFADRQSLPAERLDEILDLRYRELQTQAGDEAAARAWLSHVSQTRNPATGGEGLLRAYDLLSLKRRAFLFTVRDYNHKIAAYTDLATPERLAVPRLVAMHIQSTSANNAWERPDIRRASADEPTAEPRTTFARP